MKLENGMVCTLRKGDVLTVVLDFLYDGDPYNVLWDGKNTPSIFVEEYLDDLTLDPKSEILGTERDQLFHPRSEYDIIKIEKDGEVVWERDDADFICPKPVYPTGEELERWFPDLMEEV